MSKCVNKWINEIMKLKIKNGNPIDFLYRLTTKIILLYSS